MGTMPDLSRGALVVFSGGLVDVMNPREVRDRMDDYITAVNRDDDVLLASGGGGLTYRWFPWQDTKHLHHNAWRAVGRKIMQRETHPLILVGHSNGAASAISLSRTLQAAGKTVDLLWTCDTVPTNDDVGDIRRVPANVTLNMNSYTIPSPAFYAAPFPIGEPATRDDGSGDGIMNIGIMSSCWPGALAHRNAFYDLAGATDPNVYPSVILGTTLIALAGAWNEKMMQYTEFTLGVLGQQLGFTVDLTHTHNLIK